MLLLGAGVSWGALASAAVAQDAETGSQVGEVIVTAQRRAQNIQDVPMSVTAVTGEQMEKYQLQNFEQVEELTAGLSLSRPGRVASSTLRGVSHNPNTPAAPSVDTYINDVPLTQNSALTGLFDVEQFEVLRGPQGSLRGRPAPAGAITMTTRRPNMSQYGATVSVSHSEVDPINVEAAVSIPLIPDVLGVRLAAFYDEQALNEVYNVINNESSHRESRGYRGTVQWQALENLKVVLTHNHLEEESVIYAAVSGPGRGYNGPALRAQDRTSVSDGANYVTLDLDMTTLNMVYDFPGHQITYTFGRVESFATDAPDLDIGNALPGYAPLQSVVVPDIQYTHELRLQSDGEDNRIDYVLGLWSFDRKTDTRVVQDTPLAGAFGAPGSTVPSAVNQAYVLPLDLYIPLYSKNHAIFGNVEFHLPARTHLSVGGRYFEEAQNNRYFQNSGAALNAVAFPCAFIPGGGLPSIYPGGCDIPVAPRTVTSQRLRTERSAVYSASLRHEFTDDIMGYVSYGTSYRPGGITVGLVGVVPDEYLYFDSEKSKSVEAGLKTTWFDGRVKANIAVYKQTFDGYISPSGTIPYGSSANQSASIIFNGDAISDGVEIELSAQANDNLNFSLNLAYSDARFDNELVPCRDSNGDGVPDSAPLPAGYNPVAATGNFVALCPSNASISDQPSWMANLQAEYRAPMTFIGQPDLEGYVRGLLNYRSDTVNRLYTIPEDYNLSIYAGVQSEAGWEISAYVRNLIGGDELTSDPNGEELTSSGFRSGYIRSDLTRGREIGANIRYRFGRG